jgi:hypothetical protein
VRALVFAGHRIDAPGRESPRFPKQSVGLAEQMIERAVREEKTLAAGAPVEGFAGGASGGDILFHEICERLEVPTTLLLALPPEQYAARSVADSGAEWVERFRRLCARLELRVLGDDEELPDSRVGTEEDLWQRNNRWILQTAMAREDAAATLIALWNGDPSDGPGGTGHMVELARSRAAKVVQLDAGLLAATGAATRT